MTAPGHSSTPPLSRFAAFLRRFLLQPPFHRATHESALAGVEALPAQIVLGDLATAQVVHDLRNLLTVIVGCAESLHQQVPDGRGDLDFAELRRSVERASTLTRELLLAARPRFVGRHPVDLNEVIGTAVAALARAVGDRIAVQLRLSAEPVTIVADAIEIERILLNLAQNARDAMPDGGVLTVETAAGSNRAHGRVDAAARAMSHGRLTVSDTGRGMAPEVKARVLEPFFTTKELGIGLGLCSVALTVRHLGGTLTVDSAPGAGTSVTVTFPRAMSAP